MKSLGGRALACFLIVATNAGSTTPEKAQTASGIVRADRSDIAGRRVVRQTMLQSEILTTIDLGRIASAANGGGLIGAIIIASKDTRRQTMARASQDRSDAIAAPLRSVLRGVNVEAMARAATDGASSRLGWVAPDDARASGDAPPANIDYRYELSPDFTQARVIATIDLGRPVGERGSDVRRVTAIVQLRARSYEPGENVARWGAGGGDLAKAALVAAFDKLGDLIPYAVTLRKEERDRFATKGHEVGFAGGFYGPVIVRSTSDPQDVLLWSNGLVHVRSIP